MHRRRLDPATADPAPTADALLRRAERALLAPPPRGGDSVGALPERARDPAAATADAGRASEGVAHRCCRRCSRCQRARARAASRRWPCCSRRWSSSAGRSYVWRRCTRATWRRRSRRSRSSGSACRRSAAARESRRRHARERVARRRAAAARPHARAGGSCSAFCSRACSSRRPRALSWKATPPRSRPRKSCGELRDALEPPPPPKPTPAADADADADADAALGRELRQKIAAAAADAAADAAVAEPPPPAPAPRSTPPWPRRLGGARAPLAACARATWSAVGCGAAARRGGARRPASRPRARRDAPGSRRRAHALTAIRVVAGSSAARARRRRVLSLLAYAGAALRRCAAAARRERRRGLADPDLMTQR